VKRLPLGPLGNSFVALEGKSVFGYLGNRNARLATLRHPTRVEKGINEGGGSKTSPSKGGGAK